MRLRIALTIDLHRRHPEPETAPDRETQLDALVDMAHPRGEDRPAFGFTPRVTEPTDA